MTRKPKGLLQPDPYSEGEEAWRTCYRGGGELPKNPYIAGKPDWLEWRCGFEATLRKFAEGSRPKPPRQASKFWNPGEDDDGA